MADKVKTIVRGSRRLTFLPQTFGAFYLRAETYVFNFMKKYAENYDGGLWEYVIYPNGARAFIAPAGYKLSLSNYFEADVTAEEAGIIVALYAYSHYSGVAFEQQLDSLTEAMGERFHTLRDYVLDLPDESRQKILAAID
jgi:hypothetical protein